MHLLVNVYMYVKYGVVKILFCFLGLNYQNDVRPKGGIGKEKGEASGDKGRKGKAPERKGTKRCKITNLKILSF